MWEYISVTSFHCFLSTCCTRGQHNFSCSRLLKINNQSINQSINSAALQQSYHHQVKHINSESTAELKPHSMNPYNQVVSVGQRLQGRATAIRGSFWGCLMVYGPNPLKCTQHVIWSCECTQLPVCGTMLIEFSRCVWGCKSILIKVYQVYSGPRD